MAMMYDNDQFQSFRALAVTNVVDFKVGEKYYTYSGEFVVTKLETNYEHYVRNSHVNLPDPSSEFEWFIATDSSGNEFSASLTDNNIGTSYNPWLIFKNEDDAHRYTTEFVPTITFVDEDDWFDYDYGYDYDYDAEE